MREGTNQFTTSERLRVKIQTSYLREIPTPLINHSHSSNGEASKLASQSHDSRQKSSPTSINSTNCPRANNSCLLTSSRTTLACRTLTMTAVSRRKPRGQTQCQAQWPVLPTLIRAQVKHPKKWARTPNPTANRAMDTLALTTTSSRP